MAYVYPEDRIDDGVVMDPRPFNRTLGRYYGEFCGMLDKDNFNRGFVDTTRLVNFTGSQVAVSSDIRGPCNHVASWRASAAQTIASAAQPSFQYVTDLGGSVATQDSALVVEASITWTWTIFVPYWERDAIEFMLVVDGVDVDFSCAISAAFDYCSTYLNAYVPVGAGSHTVKLMARTYNYYWSTYDRTTYINPAEQTVTINERELIVREVRR